MTKLYDYSYWLTPEVPYDDGTPTGTFYVVRCKVIDLEPWGEEIYDEEEYLTEYALPDAEAKAALRLAQEEAAP